MAKADLTAQRLRELLSYNPDTGQFTWLVDRSKLAKRGSIAGGVNSCGYVHITIDGRCYKAHRLVWLFVRGTYPIGDIDHINHNRADNRLCNLRDVTKAQNSQNKRGARSDKRATHLVGAYWHNISNKWFSNIGVNRKRIHLGMFNTPEEAHAAYIEAKRRLHVGCTI